MMRSARYVVCSFALLQASLVASSNVQRSADVSITTGDAHSSSVPSSTSANGSGSAAMSTASGFASYSVTTSSSLEISKTVTTSTSSGQPSTTSVVILPTSLNNATSEKADSNDLPLHPIITPSIGVAGAIMMLTGFVYGLVGIKSRGVYNFMSIAYLASLAVTVLVLYVMNPPVSNAVQGAYFVAAMVTGLIFGALATVFSDLTDGLGCALGGFCVSMWILTLVPGGSIPSKGGIVGFILAFTCVAYALSFINVMREYALIGCISFAGATITVLGIDCFSRAGLKEFWIYIWDLNTEEFPLGTTTYPINRGMRVETAGIILLFLLGLVTQSKLYQKLKQRRERHDAEAARDAETREKRESAIAKRVMDHISRDRARWDSIYDHERGGSTTDGIGSNESTAKASASVLERSVSGEDVEMSDLNASRDMKEPTVDINMSRPQAGVTVTVTEAGGTDEIQQIDDYGNLTRRSGQEVIAEKPKPSFETAGRPLSALEPPAASNSSNASPQSSVRQPILVPPPVIPLPFTVPIGAEGVPNRSQSNAGSATGSLFRKSSKQKSASASLKRASFQSIPDAGPSQEDLIIPPADDDDDDQASSIAATLDLLDVDDLLPDRLPEPRTPLDPNFFAQQMPLPCESNDVPPLERIHSAPEIDAKESRDRRLGSHPLSTTIEGFRKSMVESFRLSILSDGDEERLKLDVEANEELKPSDSASRPTSMQHPPLERRNSLKSAAAKSEASHPETLASLKDSLPELPKNLMIYRTNEWAKHAADADAPVVEEIARSDSPGVQVQHEKPKQEGIRPSLARPASEASAAQPPSNRSSAQIASSPPSDPAVSSTSPVSRTLSTINHPRATIPSSEQLPVSRDSSTANVSRPTSSHKRSQLRSSRNFSTPILGTMVDEQVSEGAAVGHRRQDTDVLTPLPSDTLLDKRNSKLRQRMSTLSFAGSTTVPTYAFSSTPNLSQLMSPISPDDSASVCNSSFENQYADPDDIPLAERRAQLQRQSSSSLNQFTRQGTWPLAQHQQPSELHSMNSLPSQQSNIKRDHSNFDQRKHDSNQLQWRESISRELMQERPIADEGRRLVMIESKRRSEAMKQHAEIEKRNRDEAFDKNMRSGLMVNRHNELMRKMQASVPKDG